MVALGGGHVRCRGRGLFGAMIREIEVGMKEAGEPPPYKPPPNPAQSQPSDFERDPSLLGFETGTSQFVDMIGLVTKLGGHDLFGSGSEAHSVD